MIGYFLYKMAALELQKQALLRSFMEQAFPGGIAPGTHLEYKPGLFARLFTGGLRVSTPAEIPAAPRGRLWPWVLGAAAIGGGGYALSKLLGRRRDPLYDYYALGKLQ